MHLSTLHLAVKRVNKAILNYYEEEVTLLCSIEKIPLYHDQEVQVKKKRFMHSTTRATKSSIQKRLFCLKRSWKLMLKLHGENYCCTSLETTPQSAKVDKDGVAQRRGEK